MALYQTIGRPIHSYAVAPPPEAEARIQYSAMEVLRAAALRTGRLLRAEKTTDSRTDRILRRQHHDLLLQAWHARRCYLIHMKETT